MEVNLPALRVGRILDEDYDADRSLEVLSKKLPAFDLCGSSCNVSVIAAKMINIDRAKFLS